MSRPLIIALVCFGVANISALIFAFFRFRATRDLPPTIAEPVESAPNGLGVTPADRLSNLEREVQSLQRGFNDLHTTVETRHRSLTGFIAKKMGRTAAPVDDADDEDQPVRVPQSAFEKLAAMQEHHAPPSPPPNGGRRHLRRY